MNILIIGTGSLGIGLACSMISQKACVSLFSRKVTAKYIKNNGIERIGKLSNIKCNPNDFKVYTQYEKLPSNYFDYIFISTKTIANDEVSNKLSKNKNILKKEGKIIIFQNGFGNDDTYLRFFDKSQVYCARVIVGLKRPKPHISEVTTSVASILIGSLQGESSNQLKEVAEMINATGIETDITNNLEKELWAKMLYNCTLNPLSAILNVNYGKLIENEYTIYIINQIIKEIFKVMEKANYTTYWKNPEEYKELLINELIPKTYNHESSTLQDIKKESKTEIDSLNGKIISIARKYNIEVPTNEMIYRLIKAIESEY